MTAFIKEGAPVIVQGMTGHQGMTHTARMLRAGTNIVGGVNPRKAGSQVTFEAAREGRDVSVPVYATCAEAKEATGAQASVVFVPPRFAKGAVVEAVEAGIGLIVVITEGIPVAPTSSNSPFSVACASSDRTAPACSPCRRRRTSMASTSASSPMASWAVAPSDWSPSPAH